MTKIAALDVGTNSILMLAVEASPDGSVRPLLDLSRTTRLGRGVERNRALDPNAARLTLDTIVEFANAARAAGAGRIAAVATSVLRDAVNGDAFIAQVRERAGVELEVISGRTEAELTYLSVARGLKLNRAGRILTVDIGGGSTELIATGPHREIVLASLEIGAVRLTERIFRHDPPSPAEQHELCATIDQALRGLNWKFRPDTMVGIGGTITTLCAIALEMEPYESARVHGHVLSRGEISRLGERLGALALAEREKIKGLPKDRADVIVAGAAILERVMEHFAAQNVVVSDHGVRWGLMWRELDRLSGKA